MSPTPPLRLATRRSRLATTQAGWVADLLRATGLPVELVTIAVSYTHLDVYKRQELGAPDPMWWEQVPLVLVEGQVVCYWDVDESAVVAALER